MTRMTRAMFATSQIRASEVGHHLAPPHPNLRNVPAPANGFVGRERELQIAANTLTRRGARLLTLTGAPGIGKSRLAIEIAWTVAKGFPDGVYFVPLATVTRPYAMTSAIAQALGLGDRGEIPLEERLRSYLRDRQILLILDNLEQVEESAPAISWLLAASPMLSILATSQGSLQVYGEHELRVPPMSLPDLGCLPGPGELSQVESIVLFVRRAQAVLPGFRLDEANAGIVAEICARLDGLPLAIELAAGRMGTHSPRVILARLQSRFNFLKGGPRDLPARHQALKAAIDWSYRLLSPQEQWLFKRLSVFSGGCNMAGVEAICSEERDDSLSASEAGQDISELLEALVARNLIGQVEEEDGEVRYTMLSTLREYAAHRLAESGEADSAGLLHALYFLAIARSGPSGLAAPGMKAAFARVRREYENMRAALSWCLTTEHPEGPQLGLRLACALRLFWQIEGYLGEGQSTLAAALTRVERPGEGSEEDRQLYAWALFALGSLEALRLAERDASRHLEESLRIFRELEGQEYTTAWVHHSLGHAALHLGEATRAEECYDEALALYTELGDKAGIARLIAAQADLAIHTGDVATALERFGRALVTAREAHAAILEAGIHVGIGYICAGQKQLESALEHVFQALEIQKDVDFGPGRAYTWALLGKIAYLQSHTHRSVRFFAAAKSLFDRLGVRLEPSVHTRPDEYERIVANLRQALGEQAFLRAWDRGQKSSPEQIDRLARQCRQPGPGRAHLSLVNGTSGGDAQLTGRELEVLRLVAGGLTNAEVAEKLIVSPYTVNMHLRSIYSKLGVRTRAAATQRAMSTNII